VADVSDETSVADLFAQVEKALGGLDVLINNAGIAGPTGYVETLTREDWDRTLAVNITGQFLCARLAIPLLKRSGAGVMINLSSAAGHLGFAGRSAYSASKWAVVGFTKTLAIELGAHGIRVNAILPGAVEGPRIRAVIDAKARTLGRPVAEVAAQYESQAALGRMVSARDIANMALFTASPAAGSVSGQALVVDGHTQQLV
jgi:NAD(P)-dependent dehydrogenase (short-subunit alcohol dehydrogenase family)